MGKNLIRKAAAIDFSKAGSAEPMAWRPDQKDLGGPGGLSAGYFSPASAATVVATRKFS